MDRLQDGDSDQIGPFRLLGRLGEGGMGRMYLGESPGGSKVAVKVVHKHYASDPEFRRRFAREVAAARRVGGFHTAEVVDADPEADPPWMATAYIPGPSLDEAVAEGGSLDEAKVRRLGASLAESLAAIHECGLIHRDLKPGNIILADDGPRIIDFGIAKGIGATTLTGTRAVIGTLRFMSPEQLNGHELTPKSDVFALGSVLVFAATGHDAFPGPTIPAVITRILTGAPDLDPLTGDLSAIIGDCLAKDPSDRPAPSDLPARFNYPAALDSTVTVVRAPRPVPVAVAPAGSSQPVRRSRRMGLVAAAVVVVGFVIAGALTLDHHPARNVTAATTPPATTPPATTLPATSSAASAATQSRPAGAPPTGNAVTATLADPAGEHVDSVAFGSGNLLAAGDFNGRTYLWNTSTGKLTATLTDPKSDPVDSVAFGPGSLLAVGGYNGQNNSTYLWNTATGKLTATLTDPGGEGVDSVAFGPGGILATADSDGHTYLWNTETGKLAVTLTDPNGARVFAVAFGPGGILATGDFNGSTYLWDTATGKLTATLTDPAITGVESLAFGPGGVLAAGGVGGTCLWNTTAGTVIATLTDPASKGAISLAFGPGGILTTADDNNSTYLWDTATGKLIATLTDPQGYGATSVAFGPNGFLAAGDYVGSTYLWRISH